MLGRQMHNKKIMKARNPETSLPFVPPDPIARRERFTTRNQEKHELYSELFVIITWKSKTTP